MGNKYRLRSSTVTAHKWERHGDHPNDYDGMYKDELTWLNDGKVVKRYHSDVSTPCIKCHEPMSLHGVLVDIGGVVCPGSWIVGDGNGTYIALPESIFKERYEPVGT